MDIAVSAWGFLMLLCPMLSAFFLEATLSARRYPITVAVFVGLYVAISFGAGCLILAFRDNDKLKTVVHARIPPLGRASFLTLWILLVLFLRAIDEISAPAVLFWFFLAVEVFSANRIVSPSLFDTGFFAFCCSTVTAQAVVSFGVWSPYTWMFVVLTLICHWIDSTLIADSIAAQQQLAAQTAGASSPTSSQTQQPLPPSSQTQPPPDSSSPTSGSPSHIQPPGPSSQPCLSSHTQPGIISPSRSSSSSTPSHQFVSPSATRSSSSSRSSTRFLSPSASPGWETESETD